MAIVEAAEASRGKCVEVTRDMDWGRMGPSTSAVYYFHVENAGLYTFWCRRRWMEVSDCVWLAMRFDQPGHVRDGKKEWLFGDDGVGRPPRWKWSPVFRKGLARQFFLTAGEHVLEILNGEGPCRFDAILLTNDAAFIPSGIGGRAYVPDRERPDTERHVPSP